MITHCLNCQAEIEILPLAGCTRGLCPACIAKMPVRPSINPAVEAEKQQAQWRKIAAGFSAYLDTDVNRLPCPVKSKDALAWQFGQKGLNLWGYPRTGKTRTLILILSREHGAGHRLKLFGPGDFGLEIERCGFQPGGFLAGCRKADMIAWDDIGKVRMSPITEGHFFGLLEYFCANGKPMLFTHNYPSEAVRTHRQLASDSLERKFKNGDAIVGRLREFCQHVEFRQQDIQFRLET